MELLQIPEGVATAAENMACDACLLWAAGDLDLALWRVYGWSEAAVTFGYSQRWEWVRNQLPGFEGALVRRMTGGGIVDHRRDLTYALAVPAAHPLYRSPAAGFYRGLHQVVAAVLRAAGIPAELAPCRTGCGADGRAAPVAGICFQQAEAHDVIAPAHGAKLAGAALKRHRLGLLAQGSLVLPGHHGLERAALAQAMGRHLAEWLGLRLQAGPAPFAADRLERERRRFASAEWNQRR